MIGFPFDSHVTYDEEGNPIYDRAISSAPYRKLLRELFSTGIMPTRSDNMQVAAGEGMSVLIRPGFAVVEGCLKLEEDTRTLLVQAADSTLDRIDTVVLRLDSNDSARVCDFYIVQGVPSLVPIRPELTRTGSIYEIGLADVLISKSSSKISDSKISDTRFEAQRCGVVSSISEIDTSTLDQQIRAWSQEQQEEFSAWVESIKNILDESTAGHLQTQIDELRESAAGAKELISDAFDSSRTYDAGEICIYENQLWKSKISNNRGNFPALGNYWEETNIGENISKLTAQDGLSFDLQVDEDGNYGMLDKSGEFLSFGGQSMQLYSDLITVRILKGQTNGIGRRYTFNKKCTVTAIAYGVGSSSARTELTVTNGTLIADNVNINTGGANVSTSVNAKTYEMNVGGTITLKAGGYAGYNDEYDLIGLISSSNDYTVTSVTY